MSLNSLRETKWIHCCCYCSFFFSLSISLSCFYQDCIVYSGGKHLKYWCHCISEENDESIFSLCSCTLVPTPAHLIFSRQRTLVVKLFWHFIFSLPMHFFHCFAFVLRFSERAACFLVFLSDVVLFLPPCDTKIKNAMKRDQLWWNTKMWSWYLLWIIRPCYCERFPAVSRLQIFVLPLYKIFHLLEPPSLSQRISLVAN